MTRASVVVSILLAACASQPRQATLVSVPPATHDTLRFSNRTCPLIADTTAATRDTIYTLGVSFDPATSRGPGRDCRAFISATGPFVFELPLPSGADLRDAIDGGLPGSPRPDVVVTSDPDVLEYAERTSAFFVSTLPWSRRYTLVSTGTDTAWTFPTTEERDALARDVIRGARGAVEPFSWLTPSSCTDSLPTPASPRPLVAFDEGDPFARQLAERVVALASARPRPSWIPRLLPPGSRVTPMPADSLLGAVHSGMAAAVVFGFTGDFLAACRKRGIAPLVETRSHVIVRRGSGAAFLVGTDGSLTFFKRGAP